MVPLAADSSWVVAVRHYSWTAYGCSIALHMKGVEADKRTCKRMRQALVMAVVTWPPFSAPVRDQMKKGCKR